MDSSQWEDVGNAVRCVVCGFDYHNSHSSAILNFLLMGETNQFLTETERDQVRCLYTMGNRVRRVLSRFVYRWKWSRATRYNVMDDLAGTPLESFPADQVICLMEQGTLYHFRVADAVRIIDTSVLNVDTDMFANPLPIRNPYTNLQFSAHNLYNIYFAIPRTMTLPISMHLLFQGEFIVNRTIETWEATFRDLSIRAYVKHMDAGACAMHIHDMLGKYCADMLTPVNIADDFPNTVLVTTFRPFMYEYLVAEYGYNPDQGQLCFAATRLRIYRFQQTNPLFGRKIFLRKCTTNTGDIVREKTLCGKDTGWAWCVGGSIITMGNTSKSRRSSTIRS